MIIGHDSSQNRQLCSSHLDRLTEQILLIAFVREQHEPEPTTLFRATRMDAAVTTQPTETGSEQQADISTSQSCLTGP